MGWHAHAAQPTSPTTNATNTGLVTLDKGKETQVPIRIRDGFNGPSIVVRAVDPTAGTIF